MSNQPPQSSVIASLLANEGGLIATALADHGAMGLHKIAPLAFRARLDVHADPRDPKTLLDPCVSIGPTVNPLFHQAICALGARPNGERSYALSVGKDSPQRALKALRELLTGEICYTRKVAEKRSRQGVSHTGHSRYQTAGELGQALATTPCGNKCGLDRWTWQSPFYGSHPDHAPMKNAMIVLSENGKEVMIQVCTVRDRYPDGHAYAGGVQKQLAFFDGCPDLDLYRPQGRRDPALVTPDLALAVLDSAEAAGYPIAADQRIATLRKTLNNALLAQRIPGSPAMCRIVAGPKVPAITGLRQAELVHDHHRSPRTQTVRAEVAHKIIAQAKRAGAVTVLDPHVRDIARMTQAKATGRPGARLYQDEAISLHLSTEVGYVNACSVGLGKTYMALKAMQEKANLYPGWRGLVVCGVPLRTQWAGETARFFPEAQVVVANSHELAETLTDAFDAAGDQPVIVIAGYSTVRTHTDILAATEWDDLICDEAALLKSISSAQSKALWQLRQHARCAVGLTGTPIDRNLDDLGAILSWVRNDSSLFYAQRLSKRFPMDRDGAVAALWDVLGPTVFRRDQSEIADELPRIQTEVISLDLTPAEIALAEAARRELRRYYQDLVARIERAAELNPDDPDLAQARAELAQARGRMLGSVTLARMAAADPAAVAASDAPGANVLADAGLIAPAVKTGGTKRAWVTAAARAAVDEAGAVLVFTDFATTAEHLAEDMLDVGLRVGVYRGGISDTERVRLIRGYQGTPCQHHREQELMDYAAPGCQDCQTPDLDVLVLTRAAREGLNLQRTDTLIHFDLPWVPSDVIQRVGRAARFGAKHAHLRVLIPVAQGTIEERVAALLVPRAIIALTALDTHRGVRAADTEMGLALRGLDRAVSVREREESGTGSYLDMAAELIAA